MTPVGKGRIAPSRRPRWTREPPNRARQRHAARQPASSPLLVVWMASEACSVHGARPQGSRQGAGLQATTMTRRQIRGRTTARRTRCDRGHRGREPPSRVAAPIPRHDPVACHPAILHQTLVPPANAGRSPLRQRASASGQVLEARRFVQGAREIVIDPANEGEVFFSDEVRGAQCDQAPHPPVARVAAAAEGRISAEVYPAGDRAIECPTSTALSDSLSSSARSTTLATSKTSCP